MLERWNNNTYLIAESVSMLMHKDGTMLIMSTKAAIVVLMDVTATRTCGTRRVAFCTSPSKMFARRLFRSESAVRFSRAPRSR